MGFGLTATLAKGAASKIANAEILGLTSASERRRCKAETRSDYPLRRTRTLVLLQIRIAHPLDFGF